MLKYLKNAIVVLGDPFYLCLTNFKRIRTK